jgi:hypothetical protein
MAAETPFLEHQHGGRESTTDSVFVVTFHKTASSFFADYVIHEIPGLVPIDYAKILFSNQPVDAVHFREHGYVYGMLRLSAQGLVRERVVQPFIDDTRLRRCKTLFLIRDPRDILVSMNYSFGASHRISENPAIGALQSGDRDAILSQSLADYALDRGPWLAGLFRELRQLVAACERPLVLRYEDMIHDYDAYYAQLQPFLGLRPETRARIYAETRPQSVERVDQHKRLGKTENFRDKFDAATLAELTRIFADVLPEHGYTP